MSEDTIYALASGAGRAGIAVFRLSGSEAGAALRKLAGRTLPRPREARRIWLKNGNGEIIDHGLALWFPGPASFTGEDVVELHLHGGRAVAAALYKRLEEIGLRQAEPGEFSRRGFLAGKFDLLQAEAIADLVAADTEAQRRQALRQGAGELSKRLENWRTQLVEIQAHLEATLDFAEDGVPDELEETTRLRLVSLAEEMRSCLQERRGERLRDGYYVVILGAPNVGKSSLLNRIAGRDVAIVAATAGTTRDVVEVHLDLEGFPVILADTAGLRTAVSDGVEKEGIRRALQRADEADLRLLVFDRTTLPDGDLQTLALVDDKALVVVNKMDASEVPIPEEIGGRPVISLSAKNGEGIGEMLNALSERVGQELTGRENGVLTRERHRQAIKTVEEDLRKACEPKSMELVAEDVRQAGYRIGRVLGRVDVDEILDVIFRDFCIGK